jgi:hypothetical protein
MSSSSRTAVSSNSHDRDQDLYYTTRLCFGVRLSCQLCLLDKSRRRVASRHVDLDQSQSIGLLEVRVVEQGGELGRGVDFIRLVGCLEAVSLCAYNASSYALSSP